MKVTTVIEHEDGGCSVMLEDISKEELELLVQEGFAKLVSDYVERLEERKKIPAILKGDGV